MFKSPSHTSYLVSPMSCLWLIVVSFFVIWWPPKAMVYFCSWFFHCSIWWTKQWNNIPPHCDCLVCCLSQLYPFVEADFRLVYVSPHPVLAIYTQGPIPLSIFILSIARFNLLNDGITFHPFVIAQHAIMPFPPPLPLCHIQPLVGCCIPHQVAAT